MVKGLSCKSAFQHSKSLKLQFWHNKLILHLKGQTSFIPTDKLVNQWDLMTLLYLKSADAACISYTLNVVLFFLRPSDFLDSDKHILKQVGLGILLSSNMESKSNIQTLYTATADVWR